MVVMVLERWLPGSGARRDVPPEHQKSSGAEGRGGEVGWQDGVVIWLWSGW